MRSGGGRGEVSKAREMEGRARNHRDGMLQPAVGWEEGSEGEQKCLQKRCWSQCRKNTWAMISEQGAKPEQGMGLPEGMAI